MPFVVSCLIQQRNLGTNTNAYVSIGRYFLNKWKSPKENFQDEEKDNGIFFFFLSYPQGIVRTLVEKSVQ